MHHAAEHVACGTLCCSCSVSSEKNAIGGSEVVEECSDVQDCQRSMVLEDSEGIGLRKPFLLRNSLYFCSCSFFGAFQNVLQSCFPAMPEHAMSTEAASSLAVRSKLLLASEEAHPGCTGDGRLCHGAPYGAACSLSVMGSASVGGWGGVFFSYLLVPLPLCHQKFLKLSASLLGPQ